MSLQGPEWLEQRRKGVGASDISGVMGVSPWKTPLQVYQEKRKEVKDWEGSSATDWGSRMEPAIRQWYSDETGRAVRVPDKILCHAKYPFIMASLDGFTDDQRVVEIKTAKFSAGWGDPGTAEIPDYYMLQVQHQMLVTGYHVADVPVSIGGAPPVLYEVPEDLELQEMIIEAASEFWKRVEEGNPPEPTNYADAVLRYGKVKSEGSVIASPEDIAVVSELRVVREQLKALGVKEEELKGKLIMAIGSAGDTLIDAGGDILASYRLGKGRISFNAKEFQKDHADLYKQFTTIGEPSRRFLIRGEK